VPEPAKTRNRMVNTVVLERFRIAARRDRNISNQNKEALGTT